MSKLEELERRYEVAKQLAREAPREGAENGRSVTRTYARLADECIALREQIEAEKRKNS